MTYGRISTTGRSLEQINTPGIGENQNFDFLVKIFIFLWICMLFSWKLAWIMQNSTIIIHCSYNIIQVFFYTGWSQTFFFFIRLLLIHYLNSSENFFWNRTLDLIYFLQLLNFRTIHFVVSRYLTKHQKLKVFEYFRSNSVLEHM